MADLMREKREALARKLAQQHPQVEEFEAAGGDVEDLSGDVRGAVPEVVASPRGGETIHDALDSSRKAASAAQSGPSCTTRSRIFPMMSF